MQTPPMQIIPETVGATSAPFELGLATAHIEFTVHPPSGPALKTPASVPRRLFLRIENLTTETDAPSYDVYINVPPGADPAKHPGLKVGFTPTFGLYEASRGDGNHPGDGLGTQIEITALLNSLTAAKEWDGKSLRVTFVPDPSWDVPAKLRVGRVSLVIG